jgi:DNA-binding CsgD family transcriptional regulator
MMMTLTQIKLQPALKLQKQNNIKSNKLQTTFLQEVIEGMQDGILIVSETGKLIYANSNAHNICNQLRQSSQEKTTVPSEIWKLCKLMINNRSFANENLIISDDIYLSESASFRIRVRWINLDKFTHSCLSITIENRYESVRNAALSEVKRYELTPREAEIWLLYRANYSYKRIAEKLYITLNTVKKHMKNIHAKRDETGGYEM